MLFGILRRHSALAAWFVCACILSADAGGAGAQTLGTSDVQTILQGMSQNPQVPTQPTQSTVPPLAPTTQARNKRDNRDNCYDQSQPPKGVGPRAARQVRTNDS